METFEKTRHGNGVGKHMHVSSRNGNSHEVPAPEGHSFGRRSTLNEKKIQREDRRDTNDRLKPGVEDTKKEEGGLADEDYSDSDSEPDETAIGKHHEDFLGGYDKARRENNRLRKKDQQLPILTVEHFVNNDGNKYKKYLGQPADEDYEGRTLLHLIFKQNKKFDIHTDVLNWVMNEHKVLFKHKQTNSETILDIALRTGAGTVTTGQGGRPKRIVDPVEFFIDNYPDQAAYLIHQNTSLIHQIIPYLRSRDRKVSPKLFEPSKGMSWPCDDKGNTVLHMAAFYVQPKSGNQPPDFIDAQYNLVKLILESCPDILKVVNADRRSAYQYRLDTSQNYHPPPEGENVPLHDDKIAYFLKDKIMHLENREEMIPLLHGDALEREIHLDLVELEFSSYPTAETGLRSLIKGLKFENILQYVEIPRNLFPGKDKEANSTNDVANNEAGLARKEFKMIFDVLGKKGVQKIIKLIVDDDEDTPHSDEVIEELKQFEIEEWDWKKVDLCSEIIEKAAKNARKVYLYSSGNLAVLRSWSGSDGLCKLKELREVELTVHRRLESKDRTERYAESFTNRMKDYCENVKVHQPNIVQAVRPRKKFWLSGSEKMTTDDWMENMTKFGNFVANIALLPEYEDPEKLREPVRVAIIDDGYSGLLPYLKSSVEDGQSFCCSHLESFTRTSPYYFSSTGHGTLMARLVLEICPKARLYIARLGQGHSSSGSLQPTAESAAKAIRWAIKKKVHIISMSWTIVATEGNAAGLAELRKAIKEACIAKILMFGSSSDQGYTEVRKSYPAREDGVICIGAGRASGVVDDSAAKEADFSFPGGGLSVKLQGSTVDESLNGFSGSSFATALASGLTALILYCVEISKLGQQNKECRTKLQEYQVLMAVFKAMAERSGCKQYIAVDHFFKVNSEECDDEAKQFEKAVKYIIRPCLDMIEHKLEI